MHTTTRPSAAAPRSRVAAVAPAVPVIAARHFAFRLSVETDPADVWADLATGTAPFTLVDCRSPDAFEEAHLPGAINLPHATIDEVTTAGLAPRGLLVTYCWSAACNAATKGAMRLASLGFPVKEMLGGIEAWRAEGLPVEGTSVPADPRTAA